MRLMRLGSDEIWMLTRRQRRCSPVDGKVGVRRRIDKKMGLMVKLMGWFVVVVEQEKKKLVVGEWWNDGQNE